MMLNQPDSLWLRRGQSRRPGEKIKPATTLPAARAYPEQSPDSPPFSEGRGRRGSGSSQVGSHRSWCRRFKGNSCLHAPRSRGDRGAAGEAAARPPEGPAEIVSEGDYTRHDSLLLEGDATRAPQPKERTPASKLPEKSSLSCEGLRPLGT